jgi:glycosyltransferase involved in cell wall biosynthesis
MKKLAVLLPTYNCAQYLQESIDSILSQTYSNFDLYIYDDCSTDTTSQIISTYTDERIFYIKNSENLGIAKTLNLGLEALLPHYEYIARMDADDWSFPERFQKQIDFMESNPDVAMSGTQAYWLSDMSEMKSFNWLQPERYNYIKLYLLFSASFGHQTIVFRSKYLNDDNFRYDINIKTCEDWDLWTKIVRNYKIVNLPFFLVKNRVVATSNHRSPENKKTHLRERCIIISNYWKTFSIDLSPEQVFEYYYDTDASIDDNFLSKLKILIHSFNELFLKHTENLEIEDKKKFSYLLGRKILDYWKRSTVSRYNPFVWFVVLTRVKFMGKVRLFKSQLN